MKPGRTSGGTAAFAAALAEFWRFQLGPGTTLGILFFRCYLFGAGVRGADALSLRRVRRGARNPPVTHIQGCLAALLTLCQGTGGGGGGEMEGGD